MITLGTILIFCLVLAIPGWLAGGRRDKKIEKIQQKQLSDRQDFELEKLRIQQEFKLQLEREKAQNRRMASIEKEQAKQARELEKQRQQIDKLTFTIEQAQEDIEHLQGKLEELKDRDEFLRHQRDMCLPSGKEYWKWQDKISANDDKCARLQKQLNKAYFNKAEAEKKMTA